MKPHAAASLRAMGPVIAEDIMCHEEEGEAFLLHVGSGRYYGLNPSGLVVWRALAAGEDPVGALRRSWPETPEAQCRADYERVLESLVEAGLVLVPPDSP